MQPGDVERLLDAGVNLAVLPVQHVAGERAVGAVCRQPADHDVAVTGVEGGGRVNTLRGCNNTPSPLS